jgi:hypothetical protein
VVVGALPRALALDNRKVLQLDLEKCRPANSTNCRATSSDYKALTEIAACERL